MNEINKIRQKYFQSFGIERKKSFYIKLCAYLISAGIVYRPTTDNIPEFLTKYSLWYTVYF